jgi:hypothetical protein
MNFILPSEYIDFINKNSLKDVSNIIYEKHHILPLSLGGLNNSENICYLTVYNHFLAHLLLAKLTNNSTCWGIVHMMIYTRNCSLNELDGLVYEEIRKKYREKVSICMKRLWKNKSYRQKRIDFMKNLWKDKDYRKNHNDKMQQYYNNPEYIKNLSLKSKENWKNEEYRKRCNWGMNTEEDFKRRANKLKETLSKPESKELKSKVSKENWKNEEYRKKISDSIKENWIKRREKYGKNGRKGGI